MVYALLVFAYRRPEVSPAQFQHHLETNHLPMLKGLIGELWPVQHSFRYPARAKSGIGQRAGAPKVDPDFPVVITGDPSDADVQWDAIAEWVFRDELHFQQVLARLNQPGVGEKLKDDEEIFSLPERLKIVVLSDIKDTKDM